MASTHPLLSDLQAIRALAHKLYGQCRALQSSYKLLTSSIRKVRNALEEVEELFDYPGALGPNDARLLDQVAELGQLLGRLDHAVQQHLRSDSKEVDESAVSDFKTALDVTAHELTILFEAIDAGELDRRLGAKAGVQNATAASNTSSARLQSASSAGEHGRKSSHSSSAWCLAPHGSPIPSNASRGSISDVASTADTEPTTVDQSQPAEDKEVVDFNSVSHPQFALSSNSTSASYAMSPRATFDSSQSPWMSWDPLNMSLEQASSMILQSDDEATSNPKTLLQEQATVSKSDRNGGGFSHEPSMIFPSLVDGQAEEDTSNDTAQSLTSLQDTSQEIQRTASISGSRNSSPLLSTSAFETVAYVSEQRGTGKEGQNLSSRPSDVESRDDPEPKVSVKSLEAESKDDIFTEANTGSAEGHRLQNQQSRTHSSMDMKPSVSTDVASSFSPGTSAAVSVSSHEPCSTTDNLNKEVEGGTALSSIPRIQLLSPSEDEAEPEVALLEERVDADIAQPEQVAGFTGAKLNESSQKSTTEPLPLESASDGKWINSVLNQQDSFPLPVPRRTPPPPPSPRMRRKSGPSTTSSPPAKYRIVNSVQQDSESSDDELYTSSKPSSPVVTKWPTDALRDGFGNSVENEDKTGQGDARDENSAVEIAKNAEVADSVSAFAPNNLPNRYRRGTHESEQDSSRVSNAGGEQTSFQEQPPALPPRLPPSPPQALPYAATKNATGPALGPRIGRIVGVKPEDISPLRSNTDDSDQKGRVDSSRLTTNNEDTKKPPPQPAKTHIVHQQISTTTQTTANPQKLAEFRGSFEPRVSNVESKLDEERIRHCVHFWNVCAWEEAEEYLIGLLESFLERNALTAARRVRHLLGVCASYQGHLTRAIPLFLSAMRTPIDDVSKIDDGDCAAAYWLGDAYSILNMRTEALFAYCIAERSSLFCNPSQPYLSRLVTAEQEAVQLGESRTEFKLRWAQGAFADNTPKGESILSSDIITRSAAKTLLETEAVKRDVDVTNPAYAFALSQHISRAGSLYLLNVPPRTTKYQLLRIVPGHFLPHGPWPMMYDSLFVMADVHRGRLCAYECDLLQVSQQNKQARIPRSGSLSLSRLECFACNDLEWLVSTVRRCLQSQAMEWSEVADVRGTWFLVRYYSMQKMIATTYYFTIALFRQSLRPGYGVEICPDGKIYSARAVRTDVDFHKEFFNIEPKRIRKRIRDFLDEAIIQRPKSKKKKDTASGSPQIAEAQSLPTEYYGTTALQSVPPPATTKPLSLRASLIGSDLLDSVLNVSRKNK